MSLISKFDLKQRFLSKDMVALVFVAVMSLLANLPEGYGGWLLNRQVMLGALIAVVIVALFHFLQVLLLLTITVLAIGANLPHEMAAGLGISQTAVIVVLAALIGITLANRVFKLLPMPGADTEIEDFDENYEGAFDHLSAHQQMLYAITHGRVSMLRDLLDNGVGANFSINGTTPLHLATEKGYSGIVKMLIENGANLLAVNAKGMTPLDLALEIKKYVKTTTILYDATIPLLTSANAEQALQLSREMQNSESHLQSFTPASPYRI